MIYFKTYAIFVALDMNLNFLFPHYLRAKNVCR